MDTTQIQNSRFAGVLLSPTGIYATYNSGAALMKWRYKSELRVKTLLWRVLCQQRLAGQYHTENVYGLVLGDSMELGYQILTSTGGVKHDYFMLDGSYEHFLYLTNDHQGEVILALLCDPAKTAELDRILSRAYCRKSRQGHRAGCRRTGWHAGAVRLLLRFAQDRAL